MASSVSVFGAALEPVARSRLTLAELGQFLAATARAGCRRFHHDVLARQVLRKGAALGLAAGVGSDLSDRIVRARLGVGARGVFGDVAFDIFERQFHLLDEMRAALGLLAELRPAQAENFQTHMEQQGFSVNASGQRFDHQRFQRFNVVGQIGSVHRARRCHASRCLRRRNRYPLARRVITNESSRRFGPPSPLRRPPVDPFEQIAQLRRRKMDGAIGWGWPNESALLQPF